MTRTITSAKKRLLTFNREYRSAREDVFTQVEKSLEQKIWKGSVDIRNTNKDYVDRLTTDLQKTLENKGYTVVSVNHTDTQVLFEVSPFTKDSDVAPPQPSVVHVQRRASPSCEVM